MGGSGTFYHLMKHLQVFIMVKILNKDNVHVGDYYPTKRQVVWYDGTGKISHTSTVYRPKAMIRWLKFFGFILEGKVSGS